MLRIVILVNTLPRVYVHELSPKKKESIIHVGIMSYIVFSHVQWWFCNVDFVSSPIPQWKHSAVIHNISLEMHTVFVDINVLEHKYINTIVISKKFYYVIRKPILWQNCDRIIYLCIIFELVVCCGCFVFALMKSSTKIFALLCTITIKALFSLPLLCIKT